MNRLDEAAQACIGLFEQLGAPYAIMGGLAVRIHALPRPTFDIDFTVGFGRDDLAKLYQAAQQLGFSISAAQQRGWVDEVHGLPVIKFQWFLGDRTIDIDVFLAETPFQLKLLERRQRHGAEGWEGWFVTAEDLILLKLLADRPKDRADIADILFIQSGLDESYMKDWAQKLAIAEALDAVLMRNRDSHCLPSIAHAQRNIGDLTSV